MKYTYDCKISAFKSCPINRSGDVQITDPASRAKYCLVWLLALYLLLLLLSLPWPLSAALFFSSGVVDAFCLGDLVLRIIQVAAVPLVRNTSRAGAASLMLRVLPRQSTCCNMV